MTPMEFPEQTIVWARDQRGPDGQPLYLPLPAYTNAVQTITCWRLTWRERWQILRHGRLWLRQMNFSRPLQPQAPSVESPFKVPTHPLG
jgi:hypothetical protein